MQLIFENKLKLLYYIFIWLSYALLHYLSFSFITDIQFIAVIGDALISALLYGITGMLLLYIMKYAGLSNLNFFQRNLNYIVLFIVAIALVIFADYFSMQMLFGEKIKGTLLSFIPLKILISTLVFLLVVAVFRIEEMKKTDLPASDFNELTESDSFIAENEIQQSRQAIDHIAVKTGQKIHVIPVQDIYCLQADSDYVHIFTEKNKYLKEQTMKFFEENLPSSKFVRVHRSYIVNIEAISRVELYEKQTQLLSLKNGLQIKMSQSGYKLLKMRLNL